MIDTTDSIATLLKDTFLAKREIIKLDIPECDRSAFAIQINREEILSAWRLLRSYLPVTQRWPVVVAPWNFQCQDWQSNILDSDFFGRQQFQHESLQHQLDGSSPDTFVASIEAVDLTAFLKQKAERQHEHLDAQELKEIIEEEVDTFPRRFDTLSLQSQLEALVDSGEIKSTFDLQKCLFESKIADEIYTFKPENGEGGSLRWYEPAPNQPLALVLLPTPNGWESVAYIDWYGSDVIGSHIVAAFLKKWNSHYGAELVCHYGTMLQFLVKQRPAKMREAFQLAWEQTAIALCTILLPGFSLKEYAIYLMVYDRWFLHERP